MGFQLGWIRSDKGARRFSLAYKGIPKRNGTSGLLELVRAGVEEAELHAPAFWIDACFCSRKQRSVT